ncbi:MAG: serine protease [Paracoccaceae bacterium]
MRFAVFICGLALCLFAGVASAQTRWVQIEAQPTLREAEERARAYMGVFPNVVGFQLKSGWYAIALGPFTPEEADRQLALLRGERLVPSDSFVAFGEKFARQFWPVGPTGLPTAPAALPVPGTEPADEPVIALPDMTPPDETPAEARRSETLLSADDRKLLQEALQWGGFYASAIDGAFGPGTRRSMAAWQAAVGHEETGILTTSQRTELVAGYQAERAALGLQELNETEAGIDLTIPAALVEFDRYEPPFVHFREKDGSGLRLILISQQGDQTTLFGLYDLMQTLEIVPVEGERQLGRTNFTLTGQNSRIHSYTQAELKSGLIKGFTLAWAPGDDARAAKILDVMKASFRATGDRALSAGLGEPLAEPRDSLLAGLEIRRPVISRSGFWLDGTALVATTDEVLAECGRVTIDGEHAADVVLRDAASGLVILRPQETLAPQSHARLAVAPARISSEIAVAGYSYEDALDSAVVSFGTLADTKGLDGEADRSRLDVKTLPGDAGGPVLDGSGAVIGMLLPRKVENGRVLPDDVGFALSSAAIQRALTAAGLGNAEDAEVAVGGAVAAEDLTLIGRQLTVLVSCWR